MNFLVTLVRLNADDQSGQILEDINTFIDSNCIHVKGDYFLYEGDEECLRESVPHVEVMGDAVLESLGGLAEDELIEIVKNYYNVDLGE